MELFFAFIRKEFWHVLRDTRSLIILLGMPVMMMLLFGRCSRCTSMGRAH